MEKRSIFDYSFHPKPTETETSRKSCLLISFRYPFSGIDSFQ